MEIAEAFEKHTIRKKTAYGHEIKCSKGLWGVTAPTEQEAVREAKHYFAQYMCDGEYDD